MRDLLTATLTAMLHAALLSCLLLTSLSSSAVILDDGLPISWAQTHSQVTDLPRQDGLLTPDPWNFLQRLTFYRLMIAATDPLLGSVWTNTTDNPMWGLPLQLGWMLTSGTTFYWVGFRSRSRFHPLANLSTVALCRTSGRPEQRCDLRPADRRFLHFSCELVGL